MNKRCPFCGNMPVRLYDDIISCKNRNCDMYRSIIKEIDWNNRPIEDELNTEIIRLNGLLIAQAHQQEPEPQTFITESLERFEKMNIFPERYKINYTIVDD